VPASVLIERVADVIADVDPRIPVEVRSQLEALQARLREPARVAVIGRVKAGKSTLVNALLGQRVAPTDVSECTRVVTWFHYGHPQRVVLRLRDGTSVEGQLGPDGMLPSELGIPVSAVASIHAYLANEALRWMTLIDTPGIGSVHGDYSASTTGLLSAERDSATAAAGADAVVFLLNQVMMEDEMQALRLFRAGEGDSRAGSAANAVGVLSRADQLGDGSQDSWQVAMELAGHYAGIYRDDVATVVPVIGLVAETAETATLIESDMKHLATLAVMEPKALARMLWSADRFTSSEAVLSTAVRERLLVLLDLYGIERAVGFVRCGSSGAVALRRELSALSGIAEIKRTLRSYFHDQDHVLKVRSALELLHRMSYAPASEAERPGLAKLRSAVEALRLDPVMQPVAELEVWHDCCTGRVTLPDRFVEDMRLLFAPGSWATRLGIESDQPDVVREAAKDKMASWRTFMVTEATPAQARVARVALRSYQQAWSTAQ
jgi:hypothetical protein